MGFHHGYVNNAFVYALSNRLGRWAPHPQLVEVFANSDGDAVERTDYAGIHVLTERIEFPEHRVAFADAASNGDEAPGAAPGERLTRAASSSTARLRPSFA